MKESFNLIIYQRQSWDIVLLEALYHSTATLLVQKINIKVYALAKNSIEP